MCTGNTVYFAIYVNCHLQINDVGDSMYGDALLMIYVRGCTTNHIFAIIHGDGDYIFLSLKSLGLFQKLSLGGGP